MYNPALGRFMQTDPAGDVDSLNLYQYALWDPIMNKDPTGAYSCGDTLGEGSGSRCEVFLAAQEESKKTLTASISLIGTIKSKLANGQKLTDAEKAQTDGVSEVLGKGAGTDQNVLTKLSETASAMLGMLNSDMPAEYRGSHGNDNAHAFGNELALYDKFFEFSTSRQARTVAHEAHHHSMNSVDSPLRLTTRSGEMLAYVPAYGYENAVRRANLNPRPLQNLMIPDPAVFALGFTKGDQ